MGNKIFNYTLITCGIQQSRIDKNGSESLVKSGEYANLVEVFYASSMLDIDIDIEVFYPNSFNLFTKQDL